MTSCGWFPLSYDEIRDWVERHHDRLPKTVAELSAFPVAFRKVIVNYVSPQQRTVFWEEHLRTFLDPRSGLTPEQRKFVAEAIPFLGGIFGSPLAEGQATARSLEGRMRHVFTRQQCATIFGMVGPPEPPEGLPLPAGTRLTPVE